MVFFLSSIPYLLMLFVLICILVILHLCEFLTKKSNLLISGRFPDINNSICCYGIKVIKVKALPKWSLRICANFVIIYTVRFPYCITVALQRLDFNLGGGGCVITGKFFHVIFKMNRLNILNTTASHGVKAFVSCVHNFISYLTCNRVNVHI